MKTRMNVPSLIAALGIAAALQPPLATGQSGSTTTAGGDFAIRFGVPASAGELTTEVQAIVSRGDAFTAAQRYASAEQEYRRAAGLVRRQGHFPSYTSWHLACALYYEGNLTGAAAVLDQLADDAQGSGDLVVEALAVFNSAWLSGQSGNGRLAAAKLDKVRQLLGSPYMPASIRDQLGARLSMPNDVAVER